VSAALWPPEEKAALVKNKGGGAVTQEMFKDLNLAKVGDKPRESYHILKREGLL
jgi:hypothetical protein